MSELLIGVDDLTRQPTLELVHHHLAGMHAITPAEHVFAFGVEKLREPGVTVWSAWRGDDIVAIGALKVLDVKNAELKSMRVADRFLGTGAGRAILRYIVEHARVAGIETLWLETGSSSDFEAAQRLYLSEGFTECGPFGDYAESEFSTFMSRTIAGG